MFNAVVVPLCFPCLLFLKNVQQETKEKKGDDSLPVDLQRHPLHQQH
jgi:hypothetical protein